MKSKKVLFDRVVAELSLNTDDPFTLFMANAFALYDQREEYRAYIAALEAERDDAIAEMRVAQADTIRIMATHKGLIEKAEAGANGGYGYGKRR